MGLLQQLLESWSNRLRPDLVSFLGEVEEIGHDLLGKGAVRLKEFLADIEVENVFTVVQWSESGVDGLEFLAGGVWLFAPRKDA